MRRLSWATSGPSTSSTQGAATVPRYDAQGRELAYRWVETGVYQDIPGETIPGDAENLMGEDGSFVMTPHGREYIRQRGRSGHGGPGDRI